MVSALAQLTACTSAVQPAQPAQPSAIRLPAWDAEVSAPPVLEIAQPLWSSRQDATPAVVSWVNDQFLASLSEALAGAGFRLAGSAVEPRSEWGAPGRIVTRLGAVEGGGGVRVELTLAAEVELVSGGATGEGTQRIDVSTTGELAEGFEALEDVSTTLARLRVATAREAATRLGEEVAALWPSPRAAAPALVRKRTPVSNAWAVPVDGTLPLHSWSEIDVGLEADPGLFGTISLTGVDGSVPLVEIRPGRYTTRLRVPPGTKPGLLALGARLVDATGRVETVELGSGAMLADADRPLPPAGLKVEKAGGRAPGFQLTWTWRPESGVVHHYRVFRSDGFPYRFAMVGEARDTRFLDPIAVDEHGFFDLTRRYYTVLGYDAAGNPSPPSELVSIAPDPAATTGTVLFAPGRPRAEEAASRRDRPPVVARYRMTTRVQSPGRVAVSGREIGDPRATLALATGRITREADGMAELNVVALGSESASATASVGDDGRQWPLAEVEPGTYAGTVPLGAAAAGEREPPARLTARVRLRDSAGFETVTRIAVPGVVTTPGSVPIAPPGQAVEPEESEPE